MAKLKLHYLFDPLCGWCYASAPALARLATAFPDALHLCPTGLFAGAGARTLNARFARHARDNDQRILELTGQPFSEAYFQRILGGAAAPFDSTALTRVLTLARGLDPALEQPLFHQLQIARYVNGQDTSQVAIVARLSADWFGLAGHVLDGAELARRLAEDQPLALATAERIAQAQALMERTAARGVPLLLIELQDGWRSLGGSPLYGPPDHLIHELQGLAR